MAPDGEALGQDILTAIRDNPGISTEGLSIMLSVESQAVQSALAGPLAQAVKLDADGWFEVSPSKEAEREARRDIDRIRRRLLDLTRRNTLLNYKHPAGRCLRIVDELPDQLFQQLLAGKPFTLAPVPFPKQKDLEALRNTDGSALANSKRSRPQSREWAVHLGLATDYEVPAQSTGERRHADLNIQTLLYPDDLEARLTKILRTARTAIEESGVNILYLAFGFLEWRENGGGEPNLAPLVLLPVKLERGSIDRRTHRYKFTVEYSGEDLTGNLSLREKLAKDFGVQLPEFEEEATPESYMKQCQELCEDYPEWKIRRYITLGFFQFGKLLMYLDLDPKRWSWTTPLEKHPVISRILSGDISSDFDHAAAYAIDDIKPELPEFHLVEEADSSQHSAIVDAAKGRDLVIEGPPGTGKSQTITNIIAVALLQGKSVLFASEKMAALEVVRERLNKNGLGAFCLELHSHKTQKQQLFDDLRTRINYRNPKLNEAEIQTQIERLKHRRNHLNSYARLIGGAVQGTPLTVHDLLWKCSRDQRTLPVDILRSQVLSNASSVIEQPIDWLAAVTVRLRELRRLKENLTDGLDEAPTHPWAFIRPRQTPVPTASDVIGELKALRSGISALLAAVDTVPTLSGDRELLTTQSLAAIVVSWQALPVGATHDALRIYDTVQNAKSNALLNDHVHQEKAWRAAWNKVEEIFGPQRTAALDGLARRLAGVSALKALPVRLEDKSLSDLESCTIASEAYLKLAEAVGKVLRELAGAAPDINVPNSARGIAIAADVLDCIRLAPIASLPSRSDALEFLEDADVLSRISIEQADIKRDLAHVSLVFDIDQLPPDDQLQAVIATLSTGNIFSIFRANWRAARKVYASVRKGRSLLRPSKAKARDLDRLYCITRKRREFENNRAYSGALGQAFRGLETPTEDYQKLVAWYELLRARFGRSLDPRGDIGKAVIRLDSSAFMDIDRITHAGGLKTLQQAKAYLDRLDTLLGNERSATLVGNPYAGAASFEPAFAALNEAYRRLADGAVARDCTLREAIAHLAAVLRVAKSEPFKQSRSKYLSLAVEAGPLLAEEVQRLERTVSIVNALLADTDSSALRRIYGSCQTGADVARTSQKLSSLRDALDPLTKQAASIEDKLEFRRNAGSAVSYDSFPLQELRDAIDGGLASPETLDAWLACCNALLDYVVFDPSLLPIGLHMLDYALPLKAAEALTGYLCYNTLAERMVQEHPILRKFSTDQHEDLRAEFAKTDDQIRKAHQSLIAIKAAAKRPPEGRGGTRVRDLTDMRLLTHQLGLTRPRISVRRLMTQAGAAIQALKPCFMMGPLSVAQYLPPEGLRFDLVVMDEASQMKPEDALGAIARGKQIIVVGDPKQLPPTSFFEKLVDTDDDVEEMRVTDNQESILDLAAPLFSPVRDLQWHYRSLHESLIAFSNRYFYDDRLCLFPAPDAEGGDLGVRFHRADGTFHKGKNEAEAAEIVRGALRELRDNGGRNSIGIAAMNVEQQATIQDELDRQLKMMPEVAAIADSAGADKGEPLFVKNLENVQGDERDVIFISLTYGPDRDGNRYQRFGPINQENGWRRLNVLFSRARRRMEVYSSMDSSYVVAGPESSRGARALREFLEYCERGKLPDLGHRTGRGPDSAFEIEVADAVRDAGLLAEPQVGVCGYFIDIGVCHPNVPGSYLLGIECDGAMYHSALSARDRDKLRQSILERKGWKIHRIWSTDWYRHNKRERRRLEGALHGALARAGEIASAKASVRPTEPEATVELLESETEGGLDGRLRQLRSALEDEFPNVDLEFSLLRPDIVSLLKERRPTTREEFARAVPRELRERIDPEQAKRYLDTVLSVIENCV